MSIANHVLYINYVDMDELGSGSGVRPHKIYEAFLSEGHIVTMLTGGQPEHRNKEEIRKIRKSLKKLNFDFCYIESPVYPIMLHCDRALIRALKRNGILTAYFYRDFYRKFPDEFKPINRRFKYIKEIGLNILQLATDNVVKNCDIIYFPSQEATELFHYKTMKVLPPAGENLLMSSKNINKTGIYIGGISENYGGKLLLHVFSKLHKVDSKYKLLLVCRKNEWESFDSEYKNAEWLSVFHVQGNELKSIYNRASFAVSFKKASKYNDMAVSVKTFEYMSYGLPQIIVNNKAVAKIIRQDGLGIVADDNIDSLVSAICRLFDTEGLYEEICSNIKRSLLEKNLWVHRVRTIIKDLGVSKKE